MPYKIAQRNGKYCVVKPDNTTLKCHDTKSEAQDHLAALYANVEDAKMDEKVNPPDNEEKSVFVDNQDLVYTAATSFEELEAEEEARDLRNDVMTTANKLEAIVQNVLYTDMAPSEKVSAIKAAADEFGSRVDEKKSLLDKVKDFLSSEKETPFSVWKEGGQWMWKGVYSNDRIDRDSETLLPEAHKAFSALITEQFIPPPKLRAWHLPGPAELGQADKVWFDESTGLAWALGHFYDTKSAQAEALSNMSNLGMSHGMPCPTIKRDSDNPLLINRYISTELTVLPNDKAANLDTMFSSKLIKEGNMTEALTEERKKFLEDLQFTEDDLNFIRSLDKESEKGFVEKEEEEEEEVATQEEEKESTEGEEAEGEELRNEVADALKEMAGSIKVLTEVVGTVQTEVEALKQADAEKIALKTEDTPRMSLSEIVQASVLGKEEAQIDGRSSLGREKPKETEATSVNDGATGVPFLDAMLEGKDWREELKQ